MDGHLKGPDLNQTCMNVTFLSQAGPKISAMNYDDLNKIDLRYHVWSREGLKKTSTHQIVVFCIFRFQSRTIWEEILGSSDNLSFRILNGIFWR